MNTTKNPPRNRNPINTSNNLMQAIRFIQALARINRTVPKPSHTSRTRRIRRAAYASMACTTNPRNNWSRALLQRLRRPGRQPARLLMVRRRIRIRTPIVTRPEESSRAEELRRIVPGGQSMEYTNLLEETADYVQCLRVQVQLMQTLVDSFSS